MYIISLKKIDFYKFFKYYFIKKLINQKISEYTLLSTSFEIFFNYFLILISNKIFYEQFQSSYFVHPIY